jgi:hypothetical protein
LDLIYRKLKIKFFIVSKEKIEKKFACDKKRFFVKKNLSG